MNGLTRQERHHICRCPRSHQRGLAEGTVVGCADIDEVIRLSQVGEQNRSVQPGVIGHDGRLAQRVAQHDQGVRHARRARSEVGVLVLDADQHAAGRSRHGAERIRHGKPRVGALNDERAVVIAERQIGRRIQQESNDRVRAGRQRRKLVG